MKKFISDALGVTRRGGNHADRARTFSARPVAGLDFTLEPPLAPSGEGAPPLAPVRLLRFNPTFAFTQAAVDGEPESPLADPTQVTPDYPAAEEPAPPPPAAAPNPEAPTGEEPAPPPNPEAQGALVAVTGAMIDQLLANSRLMMTEGRKRLAKIFSRANEIKMDGILGINVLNFTLSPSSTAENVVPRFMCVTVSYFSSIDKAILANNVNKWLETISELSGEYGHDSPLLEQLLKNMDNGVGRYAVKARVLVPALEVICERDGLEFCASRISSWLNMFFKEIEAIIKDTLEANARYLQAIATVAALVHE